MLSRFVAHRKLTRCCSRKLQHACIHVSPFLASRATCVSSGVCTCKLLTSDVSPCLSKSMRVCIHMSPFLTSRTTFHCIHASLPSTLVSSGVCTCKLRTSARFTKWGAPLAFGSRAPPGNHAGGVHRQLHRPLLPGSVSVYVAHAEI